MVIQRFFKACTVRSILIGTIEFILDILSWCGRVLIDYYPVGKNAHIYRNRAYIVCAAQEWLIIHFLGICSNSKWREKHGSLEHWMGSKIEFNN